MELLHFCYTAIPPFLLFQKIFQLIKEAFRSEERRVGKECL